MGKFEKQAQELLDAIGGKENISAVTHCATRMRFVLNDDAKADKKRIENISTTKGMFTNAVSFRLLSEMMLPLFTTISLPSVVLKAFLRRQQNLQRNQIKTSCKD
jgi:glucose-like phosphotransferase system IIB component